MSTITDKFKQKRSGRATQAQSSGPKDAKPERNDSGRANGLSEAEQRLLFDFDVCVKYGPCTGMSRGQRWERAERFGLEPPADVKAILERMQDDSSVQDCVWHNVTSAHH